MRVSFVLSIAAVVVLARPGTGESSKVVALLPFENLSAAAAAPGVLSPLVAAELRSKGWAVVDGSPVDAALDAFRVRYLDSLASDVRSKVAGAVGARALALGAVYAYDEGSDPRVAFALRVMSAEGVVLFSDLVSMRSEDAEGVFEFGKIVTREELAREAVRRLCRRIPRPASPAAATRSRRRPLHIAAVRTYRSKALAEGKRYRIAVLPFANAGPHDAARIAADLFARRLTASKLFDPVDPADLRAAVVSEKIRDLSDPAELARLGRRLGTTLFLKGTIYAFVEPAQASSETPRLEMEATLDDVASGEVAWTSYASRRGSDYRGLLELGAITNIVGLADQAIAEMIHSAEKTAPAAGPRPIRGPSSRAARKDDA